MFCVQNRMSKMVRKHLSRKYVLQDEIFLDQIVESQEKRELTYMCVHKPSPLCASLHPPLVYFFLFHSLLSCLLAPIQC